MQSNSSSDAVYTGCDTTNPGSKLHGFVARKSDVWQICALVFKVTATFYMLLLSVINVKEQ